MTDESPREVRPTEALRREVEAPRNGAGMWMPMMALVSAAMLTVVSAVAVMTRPPRAVMVEPAAGPSPAPRTVEQKAVETKQLRREADLLIRHQRELDAMHRRIEEVRVPCAAPVYRGDIDGKWQPFEECITYRPRRAPAASEPTR